MSPTRLRIALADAEGTLRQSLTNAEQAILAARSYADGATWAAAGDCVKDARRFLTDAARAVDQLDAAIHQARTDHGDVG